MKNYRPTAEDLEEESSAKLVESDPLDEKNAKADFDVQYGTVDPLKNITVAVTSFLRPGYLKACLAALHEHLPQAKVIVADDSYDVGEKKSSQLDSLNEPFKIIQLPFDSGLSAKRNAIVKAALTDYILLFCEDFRMDPEAKRGVERMLDLLQREPNIDVAAGRVNRTAYEGYLQYVPGQYIRETRLDARSVGNAPWHYVDLTANYFLGRRSTMKRFPWPEECKIGGEHVCFFLDMKLGKPPGRVAFVPAANINTFGEIPDGADPRYLEYRARAAALGHEAMKRRYDIKQYIGFSGDVS